jgi:hypothetical protein
MNPNAACQPTAECDIRFCVPRHIPTAIDHRTPYSERRLLELFKRELPQEWIVCVSGDATGRVGRRRPRCGSAARVAGSFKGLEADAVVLCEVHKAKSPEQLYVAASRAKHLLYYVEETP